MYTGQQILEDYTYVIKEHARQNHPIYPRLLRFTGRKVSEFKNEVYKQNLLYQKYDQTNMISPFDLEVMHNGQILENDDELEYCLTTQNNPLIIYVPTDFNTDEFRFCTKIAIDNLESYKHFGGPQNEELNKLQKNIDLILAQYCQQESGQTIPSTPSQTSVMIGGAGLQNGGFHSLLQSQNFGGSQMSTQQTTLPNTQQQSYYGPRNNQLRGFEDLTNEFSQNSQMYNPAQQVFYNPQSFFSQQIVDLTDSESESTQSTISSTQQMNHPFINQNSLQQLSQIQGIQGSQFGNLQFPMRMSAAAQFSENYERNSSRQRALKKINVQPLIDKINNLIEIFGGPLQAFDMEWKIRLFVIEVLNYALIHKPSPVNQNVVINSQIGGDPKVKRTRKSMKLKIDGEKGIELFGKKVQPDLTVQTYETSQMLYIIEIKNFNTIKGKGILKTAISENFQQLRNFCLQKKKHEMMGISTNFGMWIFTFYSKKDEMIKDLQPFMVSDPIEIMDIRDSKIRTEELQKLILIIDCLCQNNMYLL
eukprot:403353614